ncbi:MFS transporter (Mch2) [Sporothrix schenckii 1099-18]|uniref:Major facilitator superfamily (MFS) profile domain-containing protein n=2 Tax=Sporothrix schenckii TaxID=29908 RepID=U7PZ86_SPOS1|nr:MFS transporter (Mch2) [Sporothrix schenckii 1099-18]ERT00272.1 hypothetical protein HMPREF1624_03643 [Sporothrix schenckii ATCC 58251]KJR85264.1 MFS transporter (Mch2) [Sporothrix schenckii 1099-18]
MSASETASAPFNGYSVGRVPGTADSNEEKRNLPTGDDESTNNDSNQEEPSAEAAAAVAAGTTGVEPPIEVPTEAPAEEFKEGGYGWVVVLAVFLLNAHTWGVNSAYAVFLAYYLNNDAFPGASAIEYAFVGGLSISIALLVSPLSTVCVGRFGTRATLLVGIFFETLAFIGASFTRKIWHLMLSQGIAFGIGMGFIFVASVGIVPQWFTKRRSFANALGTAGSGFGGLTYSLATNAMIRNISLAWAFRILAIVSFAANLVSTILVRDRNKVVGSIHVGFRLSLLKRVEYVLLVTWAFFCILGYIIVIFSLPAYTQAVGGTAYQGSIVAAMFNLSQGLGRPLIGFLSDPVGRLNVMGLGTLTASVSALFIWIFAGKYYAGAIIYALLGAFSGLLWATVAPVTAEIVGIPLLPAALSVLWIILVPPATCAEAIGLSLRTDSGSDSYLHVQLFAGFCFLAAFIAGWLLRAWKLHQLEDATNEQSGAPRESFYRYLLRFAWVFKVQRV